MEKRINEIDWQIAGNDIARFLKKEDMTSIDLWEKNYFLHYLSQLEEYL